MDRLIREGNPPTGQLASPVPQYKRPGSTDYEAVEGQHGAPFATLKDASGNIVSPATEAKLEQVRVLLNSINSKDFATDAKLEQARVLLNSINSKDFATNAKLEEVRALLNTINGKDFATQAELVAVKQELQAIKNSLTDGTQKVTLSGTVVPIIGDSISLAQGEILSLAVDVRGLGTKFALSGRVGHTDVELTISFANSEVDVANEYRCTFWSVLTIDNGLKIGENTPGTNKHIKVDPQVLDRVYGPWMGIHIKNLSSAQRVYNNWNLVIS